MKWVRRSEASNGQESMKKTLGGNLMDRHMSELEREIRSISDGRDQQISRAMAVRVVTLKIGLNADHLAQHTGYPLEFVRALIKHLEEAGVWTDGLLDDWEWWDSNGDLNGIALFTHAHVALGLVRREMTSSGARYLDAVTGELVGEWRCSVH
jgi:hypothetical protein